MIHLRNSGGLTGSMEIVFQCNHKLEFLKFHSHSSIDYTHHEILPFYAFPASFNALSTFSGLSGSLVTRTPVAL